ncbi:MAG TPA: aminotransferase class V-fold PLP-dependent enzyme [Oligoflexia bacterium]|nr:aminotransferase class V-fold PLP-dependent enzyme [Oligoflexia bacterium]HMP27706.1 aminotransferase class V-fold PLP-dependent enzyme [Oligoflexia bacterium]
MINFDANASYPLSPLVRELAEKAFAEHANSSSVHRAGQRARMLLEEARESVRLAIGASSLDQIIFTSGATEANILALYQAKFKGVPLAISAFEHSSVYMAANNLGLPAVVIIKRERAKQLTAEQLLSQLPENIGFISIIHGGNESGELVDVKNLAEAIKNSYPNVIFHTDASQVFGKLPLSFRELGVDLMTISGHKIGAPAGIGALIAKSGINVAPVVMSGFQEGGARPGTENLVGTYFFGKVAGSLKGELLDRKRTLENLKEAAIALIEESGLPIVPNFPEFPSLPNTLSLSINGGDGDDLVVACDLEGVLISAGSACSSGRPETSSALLGMGLSKEEADSTVRLSFHHYLTESELRVGMKIFFECVSRILEKQPIRKRA